jgi:hypothetical protein
MSDGAPKFTCAACGRSYTWTIALAGRKGKCKCGQMMSIPSSPPAPPEPVEDDMYSLADVVGMERDAVARAPVKIVDPPPIAAAAVAAPMGSAGGIPLAYQRGPTRQDRRRDASAVVIDPKRDFYVPIGMLLTGIVLSLGFVAVRNGLSPVGIVGASIGLVIGTFIETVILVIFALVAAGPLGVSFGGIGTAILKLAATVVVCDAVLAIVNGLLARLIGPFAGGILGVGLIGLPVAALVYWISLTYLFSMDSGDAWMVVIILCVVYNALRWALVIALAALFVGAIGMHGGPNFAGATPIAPAAGSTAYDQISEIQDAQAQHTLKEGKQYVLSHGLKVEGVPVNAWYQAGCPNVWFQTSRDINGHGQAFQMVVQLPPDKLSRDKCFKIAKAYYDGNNQSYLPSDITDDGDPYMMVTLASPE